MLVYWGDTGLNSYMNSTAPAQGSLLGKAEIGSQIGVGMLRDETGRGAKEPFRKDSGYQIRFSRSRDVEGQVEEFIGGEAIGMFYLCLCLCLCLRKGLYWGCQMRISWSRDLEEGTEKLKG